MVSIWRRTTPHKTTPWVTIIVYPECPDFKPLELDQNIINLRKKSILFASIKGSRRILVTVATLSRYPLIRPVWLHHMVQLAQPNR
ncbi:hypothetical protein COCC4DRAFT_168682 [Bipolaris maydis ATCC 48331]|uniref:Uncharacterized protein n=1 Tax=Cochliobolus heterostrophus (strain C4 / ATCC 48331 / race T) TaxID=665024 RepID=N4XKJ2_COCH4|nr:uncharacterized protein COCC4DRAFT_168682 [Bipolaris maydis ATCC 48331]ENI05657.1 hypothetical protein COCC4DRAFT_168682 [Bipolaris maydis ATCC 48331]